MNFLKSMLADGVNSTISSKRVITLIAFLLCGLEFFCELFFGLDVKPQTLDSMMYIVLAGLGFITSEKFVKKDEK